MKPVGTFALVLHTHLPWVARQGTWPVGEEWLHQAFTGSWQRVLAVLERLRDNGFSDVATLGVTPVLAAMLDDPYCLAEIHTWSGRWQLRAHELGVLAAAAGSPDLAAVAEHEHRRARHSLADLETRWLSGGLSSVLRGLTDAGTVEVISGPATHPFLPLLDERLASAQLETGLADTALRLGHRPRGIWAPECGHTPGLQHLYRRAGVSHLVLDSPQVQGHSELGHPLGDSDVVAFARDRPVSELVWSARHGYPGRAAYRDFHSFDHRVGIRTSRVTGAEVAPQHKQLWRPARALAQAQNDAHRFADAIVRRLEEIAHRLGRPGLVVAAFDTELFGHWWYEGPEFLAALLPQLQRRGVRLSSLRGAGEAGLVGDPIEVTDSSWGAGGDWRVWNNEVVSPLVEDAAHAQKRLFTLLDSSAVPPAQARWPALDQLGREVLMLTASDWAFMITRDSAAGYARARAREHATRFHRLADLIEAGQDAAAVGLATEFSRSNWAFGHLDVRRW